MRSSRSSRPWDLLAVCVPDDSAIFSVAPEVLLEGVRSVGEGASLQDEEVSYLLKRIGLIDHNGLTKAGTALFKTAWVRKNRGEALRALGLALRILTPVQVLEQELLQFGAVAEDGALELLRLHRAAPTELSVEGARRTFKNLAHVGLTVYSNKFKTVRAVAPPPEEIKAGEERKLAAMVSPKTPFSNIVRLRRILRTLKGTVWWADRHFGVRALEELAEELDSQYVKEIRILSGTAQNVLTPKSIRDFQRFQTEMQGKGVASEWRADAAAADWHDRWLVDDAGAWNMPPVNNLFKNDYSEMLPTESRPPVETWWNRSTRRT